MRTRKIFNFLEMQIKIDVYIQNSTKWIEISLTIRITKIEISLTIRNTI